MSDEEIVLHSKLKRRVVIDCTIETQEPLHVGIGKETISVSEVDMPTMRDSKDEPIVPGSSIKGVLRAHVTRLLSSLEEDTRNTLFDVKKIQASEDDIKNFQNKDTKEKMEIFDETFGVVDKLFGASGYASPLRITDAKLGYKPRLIERTHVRIDNDLDRAVKGGLFDVQAVPEEHKLSFKLIFDESSDPVTNDVNKVFYKMLLKQIGNGLEIFLGGMKSRGYGFCTIKAKQFLPFSPKELALGETPKPITNITQFVDDYFKE